MIDKQIHRDQFRLRILVTNGCNKNCSFCLNDFQGKPVNDEEPLFVDNKFVSEVVEKYKYLSDKLGYDKHISISGGEPGIHPKIYQLLRTCTGEGVHTMLNTNGAVIDLDSWRKIRNMPIDLRVSVGDKPNEELAKRLESLQKVSVQHVLTDNFSFVDKLYLADFYAKRGIRMKFFVNFNGNDALMQKYKDFTGVIASTDLKRSVSFRHTGIQENRGYGCSECLKRCITLKAAWVMPNNTLSPCPQNVNVGNNQSVKQQLMDAFYFHKALEN